VDFTSHPFLNIIFSLFLLFIWVAWIFIWIRIVADVLRRRDINGWLKAVWIVILIFIPLISALVYVVTYNSAMSDREAERRGGGRYA
jgi:hypothetical protein